MESRRGFDSGQLLINRSFFLKQAKANWLPLSAMVITLGASCGLTILEKFLVGLFTQRCLIQGHLSEFWPRLLQLAPVMAVGPMIAQAPQLLSQWVSLSVMNAIRVPAFERALSSLQCDAGSLNRLLGEEIKPLTAICLGGISSLVRLVGFGLGLAWVLLRHRHRRPQLTKVLFLLGAVIVFGVWCSNWLLIHHIKPRDAAMKHELRRVDSCVVSDTRMADTIQAYGLVPWRTGRMRQQLEKARKATLRKQVWVQFWGGINTLRQQAVFWTIYCVAGKLVMEKGIEFVDYHTLFNLAINFAGSISGLQNAFGQVVEVQNTITKVNELTGRGASEDSGGLGARQLEGSLVVRDLHVEQNGAVLVDGCSFELRPGTVTALVGSSGAGKSSLLRAIAGLLPNSGYIGFGDASLNGFGDAPDAIAWVGQDPGLLEGSVMDNILVNRPKNESQLRKATTFADFSTAMMDALNTPEGRGNQKWSGGELQRITIARAIYGNPKVLLMDEPTSALDAESETIVIENTLAMAKREGIAVLIVTHRLWVAEKADHILVMDDGRIVEQGFHQGLIKQKGGLYWKLCDRARF